MFFKHLLCTVAVAACRWQQHLVSFHMSMHLNKREGAFYVLNYEYQYLHNSRVQPGKSTLHETLDASLAVCAEACL